MIRLALLRHGHTAWNRAGRIQGQSDIPLDDQARADLRALTLPEPWTAADLVSSPLIRAVDTARIVGGRDPRPADPLLEMNWGHWEGQHGVDLLAQPGSGYRHIEAWGWDFRPPGGESPADLRDRLLHWVTGLERDTVAVGHIGVMRVLMACATGWNFEGPAPFAIKRNRLYIVTVDGRSMTPGPGPIRLQPREPNA